MKADGWFNLLAGLGDSSLGGAVVFSSIAGRFGNGGQTDYSAANDLLCKLVSNLGRTRPGVCAVAIDWTAWGEIGMASRGSIPKMMQLAGIEMLPPAQGVPAVYAELVRGSGEVVIAGQLGALVAERSAAGGLAVERAQELARAQHRPMLGQVLGCGVYSPLTVETTLDPRREPFLDHHRIDGTAVLPGVMGLESFAELAVALWPQRHVRALLDVRFEAPFKFYRDEPRTLRLEAWLRPAPAAAQGADEEADELFADCRLTSVRQLPGRAEPQLTTHFTARVQLARGPAAAPPPSHHQRPARDASEPVRAAEIYRTYFHGPAYQVLEAVWIEGALALGQMAEPLPPDCADGVTLLDPRAIELCFQTAGIWEARAHAGRLALPRAVEEVRWFGPLSARPATALTLAREDGRFDAEVLDASGAVCLRLRGYQTITTSTES